MKRISTKLHACISLDKTTFDVINQFIEDEYGAAKPSFSFAIERLCIQAIQEKNKKNLMMNTQDFKEVK